MPALLMRMSIGPLSRSTRSTPAADGLGVGDVEGRGRGAGDARGGGGEARGVAAVQDHRRAVGGEAGGEGVADALARSGDERPAAGEVEEGKGHRVLGAGEIAASSSPISRVQTSGGCAPETA